MLNDPMLNIVIVGVLIYVLFVIHAVRVSNRTQMTPQDDIDGATGHAPPLTEAPHPGESSYGAVDAPPVTLKRMLLITHCSDPQMWYADLVGKQVPYLGEWPGEGFKSREKAGYVNLVKFADARIVVRGPK